MQALNQRQWELQWIYAGHSVYHIGCCSKPGAFVIQWHVLAYYFTVGIRQLYVNVVDLLRFG